MTATEETRVDELCTALLEDHPPSSTPAREFLGHQYDAGLAWVHFPGGFGGLGLSPRLQSRIQRTLMAGGAPNPMYSNPIGYGMGAPTIVTHGTDEQRRRYLRPLFTGEEVWCQLFSEPGAGSDVAGLATKAVQDGDEWIVTGQKVWTTVAHLSKWGMLVARTDPSQPKHKGMTYFMVDMEQPGVEVRPLRQITGEAEFNEVYFTEARVPDANRLDAVGEGWRVALTTLMNERVSIGGATPPRGAGPIAMAVELWNAMDDDQRSGARRDELMKLWVTAEVHRLTNTRAAQNRRMGTPGPEGSVGKVVSAEFNKEVFNFMLALMGGDGMLYGSYELDQPSSTMDFSTPQKGFLRSRANSIEGGTSEVMRNIIGERVLGLPGDVRVDKGVPWIEVPRN